MPALLASTFTELSTCNNSKNSLRSFSEAAQENEDRPALGTLPARLGKQQPLPGTNRRGPYRVYQMPACCPKTRTKKSARRTTDNGRATTAWKPSQRDKKI